VMWHWLHVSPVCRVNDGTALALLASVALAKSVSAAAAEKRLMRYLPGRK
jgi:hypothetical protein